MPGHERFQEICATASIGQASGTELADLREHLASCSECCERYGNFMELQASHYALNAETEELGADEAMESIDSALFRERFLRRAESEGIVFSAAEPAAPLATARIGLAEVWNWPVLVTRIGAAAAMASALILSGFYLGTHGHLNVPATVQAPRNPGAGTDADHLQKLTATIASLEEQNHDLSARLVSLRASLGSNLSQLQVTTAASEQLQTLASVLKERDATIAELQGRLGEAQASVAGVRAELEKVQAGASENQASLVESQIRVGELSEQLAEKSSAIEREKELFVAGRDVRELMAARNLHIVDVFDTDPKGKTRPSFGRIFFTEGKSLIFYAYDLNDAKVQNAGYHYRVWGKREGPGQRARSLGMFYSDDKSQKRWVFQSDDPQILNEIDSVFVTLEPPNGNPAQPKGDKLMYAYLRSQANHP